MTALLVLAALLCSAQPFEELAKLYAYDRSTPLEVDLKRAGGSGSYSLYSLSYATPGGRATGYLVVPAGAGRKPGIVWMHSGGPIQWLGDAILLARAGAVCVIISGPSSSLDDRARAFREEMVDAVIAIRRAADVLASRDDVDSKRIGYAGHSYGAMMGAVATSIDSRFRAAVFEVGLLGMSIHIGTSPHPWAEGIRKNLGPDLPKFLETISAVDAKHYIGHAPAIPKLFQAARYDPGVPEKDAQDFYRTATEPKEIKWYDTGHDIDDIAAIADRARFLATALGIKGLDAVLKEKTGR